MALYLRVSTQEQAEGHSLDTQRDVLTAWAEREGWTCAEVYADAGASGTRIAGRVAFQRMLRDAETHAFDAVLVKNRSRYARDVADALLTERQLLLAGVRVLSLDEPAANDDTPGAFLFRGFSDLIAHHYSVELSHKTRQGWRKRAEKGLTVGDLPFGYRSTGPHTPPTVEPSEADAVRAAFERYAMGDVSLNDIADQLNRGGLRPRSKRGTPHFGQKTVRGMLANRFYVGDIVYHGAVVSRGLHEPLIDKALFDRVQRARQARIDRPLRARVRSSRPYLLRGIARCAVCGGVMWANTLSHGSEYRYYRCASRLRGHDCDAVATSVRADQVEASVDELFESWKQPADWREQIAAPGDPETAERTQLQARIARTRRALLDGLVDYEETAAELRVLEGRLKLLEPHTRGSVAGDELTNIRELWPLMSQEERRALVTLVIEDVVLDMDSGTLVRVRPHEDFGPLFDCLAAEESGLLAVVDWRPRSDSNRT